MHTLEDLKTLQSYPLWLKVKLTRARIQEWVSEYGTDGVYVSFSGGKDSTVLLHIVREMYPEIEAVFVNTGLEYPEIQTFAKSFDNVTVIRPKMRFDEVIKKYGYPFISKDVSECISQGRNALTSDKCHKKKKKLMGTALNKDGTKSKFNKEKYKPLLYVDFKISNMCCNVMKKEPIHTYNKSSGKYPITAQMAEESMLRTQQWLKNGCNGFDMKLPISNPMSFWTEQDILQYIKENSLPIASVYGDIVYSDSKGSLYDNLLVDGIQDNLCTTGCKRTGCIFCAYGAHLEKGESRFERLKRTHPRQYEYCMGGGAYDKDGFWKPTKDGLGLRHCIDVLNSIYGENFIKY